MSPIQRRTGSVALVVAVAASIAAAPARDPSPEALLRQMGDHLADAKSLRVKAVREVDPSLSRDTGLAERAEIDLAVLRPDKVAARSVSEGKERRFLADGETVLVIDDTMKLFAKAPVPGNIDAMAATLEERYGFSPPIVELVSNDPHAAVHREADIVTYGGRVDMGGESCHRLLLEGQNAEAQLFLAVDDQLPCGLDVTFTDAAEPQSMKVRFTDWELNAKGVDDSDFVFEPPKDFEEVEMVPSKDLVPPERTGSTR